MFHIGNFVKTKKKLGKVDAGSIGLIYKVGIGNYKVAWEKGLYYTGNYKEWTKEEDIECAHSDVCNRAYFDMINWKGIAQKIYVRHTMLEAYNLC